MKIASELKYLLQEFWTQDFINLMRKYKLLDHFLILDLTPFCVWIKVSSFNQLLLMFFLFGFVKVF